MRSIRAAALAVTATVALLAAAPARGDDIPLDQYVDELQGMLKDVLQINIRARVLSSKEQSLWEMQKQAYTVPGLEVAVKVPSKNLVILAYITPERLKDDRILLRVHAELRPAGAPEQATAQWSTEVNYIPADLGDKIRFYPLGQFPPNLIPDGTDAVSLYNLELEIQIVPYPAHKE